MAQGVLQTCREGQCLVLLAAQIQRPQLPRGVDPLRKALVWCGEKGGVPGLGANSSPSQTCVHSYDFPT